MVTTLREVAKESYAEKRKKMRKNSESRKKKKKNQEDYCGILYGF